ncbi:MULTISPECIES: hypothetical protein [Pseudomonas]|uniref:Uncharacterized protein n=1 Tax=Pseudomonas putida TaxID=303 RepID=A0A7W2L375_PSEPU|nr:MULTISPECIES: hypothetical protein [Pseudomonas]MBA6117620.1 hypothetical protein [Pseudomonas putida]PZQ35194.1 MAG: hypothetical protein DI560_26890 [Pseudomonas putida]QNL89587.1 Uncharacterized protein PPKH_4173 [Pseudomonas putida]
MELREIQPLRTVGNAFLVGDGMEPDVRVVTEGIQQVRSTSKVNASEVSSDILSISLTAAT